MTCYDIYTPAYCWEKLQEAIELYNDSVQQAGVKKFEDGDSNIELHNGRLELLRENIEYWNDKYREACEKANGGSGDYGNGYCVTVEDDR